MSGESLAQTESKLAKENEVYCYRSPPLPRIVYVISAGVPLISVIITCRIGVNIPFDLKYFKWKLLPCMCKLHFHTEIKDKLCV